MLNRPSLPWGALIDAMVYKIHFLILVCSKFFGKPNGLKTAPPKQSKLTFSSKSSAKDIKTPVNEEDVEMKDEPVQETNNVKKEESPEDTRENDVASLKIGNKLMTAPPH